MTPDKFAAHAAAAGRAQHAGARARESGSPADWKRYAAALEDLSKAVAELHSKTVDTGRNAP